VTGERFIGGLAIGGLDGLVIAIGGLVIGLGVIDRFGLTAPILIDIVGSTAPSLIVGEPEGGGEKDELKGAGENGDAGLPAYDVAASDDGAVDAGGTRGGDATGN